MTDQNLNLTAAEVEVLADILAACGVARFCDATWTAGGTAHWQPNPTEVEVLEKVFKANGEVR